MVTTVRLTGRRWRSSPDRARPHIQRGVPPMSSACPSHRGHAHQERPTASSKCPLPAAAVMRAIELRLLQA